MHMKMQVKNLLQTGFKRAMRSRLEINLEIVYMIKPEINKSNSSYQNQQNHQQRQSYQMIM